MSAAPDARTNETTQGAPMSTEPTTPWTPLSPLGRTPSSAHSPAEASTDEETTALPAVEEAGVETGDATEALPLLGHDEANDETEALPLLDRFERAAGTDATAALPLMSSPTGAAADAGTEATTVPPVAPPLEEARGALDEVWSVTAPRAGEEPTGRNGTDRRDETATRGVRPMTIVWGLLLAALGAGTIATGLGARLDLALSGIILLAGLGVVLLVLAALPPRRGRQ